LRPIILLSILFTALSYRSSAQEAAAIVSSIEITGDHKLDKDFILNRITTKFKGPTTWEKLNLDQQRLNRLNGIQHTVIEVDTLADKTLRIQYDIRGQKTIKPFVGLGRVKGNFWWQLGAAEYNLFRKNQTLIGYFQSQDSRPNGKLFYSNPNVNGGQFGFNIDAFYNASTEPLFFDDGSANYNYDLLGVGLGGILHLGLLDKLHYTLTVFNEEFRRIPELDISLAGPEFLSQLKILNSIGFVHDRVKYDFYHRKGYQHQVLLQNVSIVGEDIPFWSVSYEGRHYWRPKPKLNIAVQLRMAIGTNRDSPFAPFVLDSNFNLRGVGNRVDRATAQVVINIELRQTVWEYKNIAVQAVAFSDSGSWRSPGSDLNIILKTQNFRSFVGGGARVILTKVFDSVFRIDYGFDLYDRNTQGLVIGFGQFF